MRSGGRPLVGCAELLRFASLGAASLGAASLRSARLCGAGWSAVRGTVMTMTMTMTMVVVMATAVPGALAQPAPDAAAVSPTPARITAAGPPAGTVLRAGRFVVDPEGRVLFLHGLSVPPGGAVDAAIVGQWAADGFNAVRIGVRMEADGTFTGTSGRGGVPARVPTDGSDPGLDQLADAVRAAVGQGLRTMIQIVPTASAARAGDEALAEGLRRVVSRFRDVVGLVGFELTTSAGSPGLNGAVRDTDAHHLLWRQSAASFDPTANVVTNDEAALLVGWAAGDPMTVLRLVSAADTTQIGWFFDRPLSDATLATIARPYPAAVAGVPVGFTYSPSGHLLTLSYIPAPAGGGTFGGRVATQIRVPARVYPDGYVVRASGATVVSAPGAGVVCLVTDARASRVDVRVEPAIAGQVPPVAPPMAGDPCPASAAQSTTAPAPGQSAG
ncbi:hypothetical protein, partial [Frankia sp. Cr2]|uniref:hypothetical protein n=1 Tax=Frankia sp. Cr2 TaxID=3073932 RepID=UPI002AD2D246